MNQRNTTAQAAYAARQAKARELLQRLSQALDAHACAAAAQPGYWGYAGDLDLTCRQLLESLGSLGALSVEELAEHRI